MHLGIIMTLYKYLKYSHHLATKVIKLVQVQINAHCVLTAYEVSANYYALPPILYYLYYFKIGLFSVPSVVFSQKEILYCVCSSSG